MADVVDKTTRSRMMSGIRGKNTKPELIIRSALHKGGYRFRLHDPSLPGKPDIVLRRYKAIILVHGCFWHGHQCPLFKWPATRINFWKQKINDTCRRDQRHIAQYLDAGWRVLIVWECALKGSGKLDPEELITLITDWIQSIEQYTAIPGYTAPFDQK